MLLIRQSVLELHMQNHFCQYSRLLDQPGTQYTVYHGAHKCRSNNCTLSKDVSSQSVVINQFVSQDTVTDRCEILTDDPNLILKYNKIIEDNDPLFSTHAFDIGKCRDSQTGQVYKFSHKLKGEVTPFIF